MHSVMFAKFIKTCADSKIPAGQTSRHAFSTTTPGSLSLQFFISPFDGKLDKQLTFEIITRSNVSFLLRITNCKS